MNNQSTYKKLAELSFEDLYVETKKVPVLKMAMGRAYATIHRRSQRMPQSLKVATQNAGQTSVYSEQTYVIPQIRQPGY